MVTIQHNINLKPYHTFGFESIAQRFVAVSTTDDIRDLIKTGCFEEDRFYILGGGSNTLFRSEVRDLIVHPNFSGITIVDRTDEFVVVEAGASMVWDDFVAYCVEQGFYGVENLSLIPGNVGAAPVQNIGAYGVEACDTIVSVTVIDLETGHESTIDNAMCLFGYRDSVFKHDLKNRVVVTSVRFRLGLTPRFQLGYGHVAQAVEARGEVTLKNVRETIIDIRRSKLPDPEEFGNAGSFFKNPVVGPSIAEAIRKQYPQMPEYSAGNGHVKIPAGWLIETCGWKGRSMGQAAVHDKQALVLVNKGGATCEAILQLAKAIEDDVFGRFGIRLEKEVIIVG